MAQAIFPTSKLENILREQELLKRPEVKRMTQIDRAMADILSRSDLTARQKIRQYDALIQPFRAVRENIEKNGTQITSASNKTDELVKELLNFITINSKKPANESQRQFQPKEIKRRPLRRASALNEPKLEWNNASISSEGDIAELPAGADIILKTDPISESSIHDSRSADEHYFGSESNVDTDNEAANRSTRTQDNVPMDIAAQNWETIIDPTFRSVDRQHEPNDLNSSQEMNNSEEEERIADQRNWNNILKTAFSHTGRLRKTSDDEFLFNTSNKNIENITDSVKKLESFITFDSTKPIPKKLKNPLFNIIRTIEEKDPALLSRIYQRYQNLRDFINDDKYLTSIIDKNDAFKTDYPGWNEELTNRESARRVLRTRRRRNSTHVSPLAQQLTSTAIKKKRPKKNSD
jgi:hypothetical protein